jgi:16S rRNA processing protein RimM
MDLFEIGRVLKPRGLKGQMRCFSFLSSHGFASPLTEVYFRTDKGISESHPLQDIIFSGKFFFLSVAGIDSSETAGEMSGADVLASSVHLHPLEEDEYYWKDIIGLDVVTETGQLLGKVESVFSTGSNDVYVCRNAREEILLPAIKDVVIKVDLAEKRIVVNLLEGL